MLGYEGSHIYKINGRYYVFFIHSLPDRWLRCEACFSSDSLEGEFTGGDCLEDTMGYCGQGVAQGGIVDTPDGNGMPFSFRTEGQWAGYPFSYLFHGIMTDRSSEKMVKYPKALRYQPPKRDIAMHR